MILWTEKYATGIEVLDQHHRVLIDSINRLGEQLHNSNPTLADVALMIELVAYLGTYADIHFWSEEKCMESHRCPAHAENQQAHAQFREFIQNYQRQCEHRGFNLELLRELHEKMQVWIQDHILKIDTQLRPCISGAIQAGASVVPES